MKGTFKSHILRWESDFFALFALSGQTCACGPHDITTIAEKVCVSPVSLPLMTEPKGKKMLDVDIYATGTDGAAFHERVCHGTVR